MTQAHANALALEAERLGYRWTVKQLIGGSYRVYLTRDDGRWTFLCSKEDLGDVHNSNNLWSLVEDMPEFVHREGPDT